MSEFTYKQFTRRNLPHIHPPGATLVVTFRLADTIPQPVLRQWEARKRWLEEETQRLGNLKSEVAPPELAAHEQRLREWRRQWFAQFEDILHREETGPTWLKEERIAGIVTEALHYRDGRAYRLEAYCVMSVFTPLLAAAELREEARSEGLRLTSPRPPLAAIRHSLKGHTARQANRTLERTGPFWEQESYDHAVRDAAEFERIVR
jgi:putative transposase